MKKVNVGIVGCGNISDIYFTNLTTMFPNVNVIGCCDLFLDRAKQKQEKYKVEKIGESDFRFKRRKFDRLKEIREQQTKERQEYNKIVKKVLYKVEKISESDFRLKRRKFDRLKEIGER